MEEKRWSSPKAPPFLGLNARWSASRRTAGLAGDCVVSESTRDTWDHLFKEGYRADVIVHTTSGNIPAHASVLGMASPIIKQMVKSQSRSRKKSISIGGVPHRAVHVFLRFLYSSCYEEEEMKQYVMHLLVLSHAFGVSSLKKLCVDKLEKGLLNLENVVDLLQLGELCDAPRLSLLCNRMIINNFEAVSASEGWKVMKQSNPCMEKEILDSVVQADLKKKEERLKLMEERKFYLQLHEAMEALVHICRDGCRTIGPYDKVLKRSSAPCNFPACKGMESLFRHFAGCNIKVLGGCSHCKRMWQLLKLHSRLCEQNHWACKVPFCWYLKDQSGKEELKWKLLVSKVLEAKTGLGEGSVKSYVCDTGSDGAQMNSRRRSDDRDRTSLRRLSTRVGGTSGLYEDAQLAHIKEVDLVG